MKTLFLISMAMGAILTALSAKPVQASCTTAREYITTLEYLRDRKEMAIPEADAQKFAAEASRGCTGAAKRFIRVTSLLTLAGLGPKDSIHSGLNFSSRTDMETETFLAVFTRAFFKEYLDLDLRSSLKMAESLTKEFEGDTLAVRKDFEKLLDFCIGVEKLDLPRPQCAAFAARVARLGHKSDGGISSPFVQAFEFIRTETGPNLATSAALGLAEKIIASGPGAPENFITAYKYGTSKKGLNLPTQEALNFAIEMGKGTASDAAPAPKTVPSK